MKSGFVASINEESCTGCTRCAQVCPEKCISGERGVKHIVDADVCTGCGKCLPVCPVDCISMLGTDGRRQVAPKVETKKMRRNINLSGKMLNRKISPELQEKIAAARERSRQKHSAE